MSYTAHSVDVRIINRQISLMPKAIGRTAAVLAAAMPYSVEQFSITPIESGMPTTAVTVDRSDLEAQATGPTPAHELGDHRFAGAWPVLASGRSGERDVYPLYSWAIIPVPTVQLFGGNDGFRPQLTLQFRGSVSLSPGLSAIAMVRQPLLGVFDDPGPTESSGNLPPVRSQSKRYYSGCDPKLIRLTGDYLFKLNRDTYARASAGILERAFAGVDGEVLWKPVDQNWGLGLEVA